MHSRAVRGIVRFASGLLVTAGVLAGIVVLAGAAGLLVASLLRGQWLPVGLLAAFIVVALVGAVRVFRWAASRSRRGITRGV
ncbi:MAG: hypothetical protein ACP5QO_01110 [Clostridia bacterium]